MGKELVIIGLAVPCLAFSVAEQKTKRDDEYIDGPESNEYTEVDVNNPRVQEAAQQVLIVMRQEEPDCQNATLIEVTKAKHKLYLQSPADGAVYDLELGFSIGDDRIQECKVEVFASLKESSERPNPAPYTSCNCTKVEEY